MGLIRTYERTPIGKINVEIFDAPAEVVEDSKRRVVTNHQFHDMKTYRISKSDYGVDSYDEAMELMEKGYQANVEKLDNFDSDLQGIEKRITFANDIVGYAPVVPLAIMGVPNCMMNSKQKPIKAKVLDVYYDMTARWGTTPEQFIKAGQKMLTAIMQLEMQGYKFNLYTTQTYYDKYDNDGDMLAVKIKGSNEPLNIKRMSFAIAHPAFFRVVGWDWYSRFPKGKYRDGYGSSPFYMDERRDDVTATFKQMFGDNAVCFSATELIDKDTETVKELLTSKE